MASRTPGWNCNSCRSSVSGGVSGCDFAGAVPDAAAALASPALPAARAAPLVPVKATDSLCRTARSESSLPLRPAASGRAEEAGEDTAAASALASSLGRMNVQMILDVASTRNSAMTRGLPVTRYIASIQEPFSRFLVVDKPAMVR